MAEDKKHPGGCPLKYKSAEELQEAIDFYFNSCMEEQTETMEKDGIKQSITKKVQVVPFTLNGLAEGLDIGRVTLWNYEKRDMFVKPLKRARRKIQTYIEKQGMKTRSAGFYIFQLKNIGADSFSDKQEIISTVRQTPLISSMEEYEKEMEKIKKESPI